MKIKIRVLFGSIVVFLICEMSVISPIDISKAQEKKEMNHRSESTKKEAVRLWEQAVLAKGGRQKLYSIKNMVKVSREEVQYSDSKTHHSLVESLFVFPDKTWTWRDYRPSVFGLAMQMYDYKKGIKYHLQLDALKNNSELVPFEESEKHHIGNKMPRVVIDLLETYWLKPVPQTATTARIHGKSVDVIETSLEGNRIDFALDQRTHLPIQVSYYDFDPIAKRTLVNKYNLSDYVSVDKLMMATTIRPEGESGNQTTTYLFNVEYEESIFEKPPAFEAGPEAWRKGK